METRHLLDSLWYLIHRDEHYRSSQLIVGSSQMFRAWDKVSGAMVGLCLPSSSSLSSQPSCMSAQAAAFS